jgi:hypothetical protein
MCKNYKEEYKTQMYPFKLKMTQTQLFENFLKYVRRPKTDSFSGDNCPEAEKLDEIQTKVLRLRVFLLAIYSQLNSFALTVLFSHTYATSYSVVGVQLLISRKEEKEENPFPIYPYRNFNPENSQDYAQKPQRNCTFIRL